MLAVTDAAELVFAPLFLQLAYSSQIKVNQSLVFSVVWSETGVELLLQKKSSQTLCLWGRKKTHHVGMECLFHLELSILAYSKINKYINVLILKETPNRYKVYFSS